MKKKRRGPVFPISAQEVIRRCQERHHDLLCAADVLALMDLMQRHGYSIQEMHELSHVSRAMIHDMLVMDAVASNDVVGRLGAVFHLKCIEMHLYGSLCLRAELSP